MPAERESGATRRAGRSLAWGPPLRDGLPSRSRRRRPTASAARSPCVDDVPSRARLRETRRKPARSCAILIGQMFFTFVAHRATKRAPRVLESRAMRSSLVKSKHGRIALDVRPGRAIVGWELDAMDSPRWREPQLRDGLERRTRQRSRSRTPIENSPPTVASPIASRSACFARMSLRLRKEGLTSRPVARARRRACCERTPRWDGRRGRARPSSARPGRREAAPPPRGPAGPTRTRG